MQPEYGSVFASWKFIGYTCSLLRMCVANTCVHSSSPGHRQQTLHPISQAPPSHVKHLHANAHHQDVKSAACNRSQPRLSHLQGVRILHASYQQLCINHRCRAWHLQVYFNDAVVEATAAVDSCLAKWSALLESLPEGDRHKLQRSMGLKMEQLKVGIEAGQLGA